jgi:DNA invertase Pin-like site-specific DNA recombinase
MEIESGRRHRNRPKLLAALAMCEERGAVLVIAKLDRLARNVHFISGLMNSKVEFAACDMPTAGRITLHILAAVAEHEREMASTRTKESLAAAKAKGKKLGSPRAAETIAHARAAIHHPKPAPQVAAMIENWHRDGKGFRQIARDLNHLGNRTPRGGQCFAQTVKNQLASAQK